MNVGRKVLKPWVDGTCFIFKDQEDCFVFYYMKNIIFFIENYLQLFANKFN